MSLFGKLLREALKEFAEHGYRSEAELQAWLARLHGALDREMPNDDEVRRRLWMAFETVYHRLIARGGIEQWVPGVSRYTLAQVAPRLRADLDRRIMAGVGLIKLNKEQATAKTLQRFAGWITSIPAGGSGDVDLREAAAHIGKAPAQVRFEARRVAIDQGHKLAAAVAATVADGAGAIAAIWHSNWRRANYDYRPDHKARDGVVYAIRGCWAIEDGLMKRGKAGYLDDITQPGEEVFCRCTAQYITSLRDLPDEMLTRKGQESLRAAA